MAKAADVRARGSARRVTRAAMAEFLPLHAFELVAHMPGFGLATLRVRWFGRDYGPQPFTRWRARKAAICAATGARIKPGDAIYAPVTNRSFRGVRVLAAFVEGQACR